MSGSYRLLPFIPEELEYILVRLALSELASPPILKIFQVLSSQVLISIKDIICWAHCIIYFVYQIINQIIRRQLFFPIFRHYVNLKLKDALPLQNSMTQVAFVTVIVPWIALIGAACNAPGRFIFCTESVYKSENNCYMSHAGPLEAALNKEIFFIALTIQANPQSSGSDTQAPVA